jgi:FkbM family methyltransferase
MKNYARKLVKAIKLSTNPLYRHGLKLGVAAAIEHEKFLASPSCKNITTIIDAGANTGQFSLAAKKNLPECEIIAFEPLGKPANKFRAVFEKHPTVTLHEIALGSKEGIETIHVSNSIDSSSLLPITKNQNNIFPGTSESHVETVAIAPLSKFLSENIRPNSCLLKIDVQGYELEVLVGCESMLSKVAVIYAECSFIELYSGQPVAAEVIKWLDVRGFSLAGFGSIYFDDKGTSIQGDLIFTK